MRIDGVARANGEVLVLQGDSCVVSVEGATAHPVRVRFVWADAAPAPEAAPPNAPIYTGL